MARFNREESPPAYSDHREYVPFLRKDFQFRCAYCERTEAYFGGEETFEVDHFKPEQKFPELRTAYENLYYSCRKCNGIKWKTWPTEDQINEGTFFADPCVEDPYEAHLSERPDGGLDQLTACGAYTNRHIRLDRPSVEAWRHRRREARRDLPRFKSLESDLVHLMDFAGRDRLAEIEAQLEALRRHIDEIERIFLIS